MSSYYISIITVEKASTKTIYQSEHVNLHRVDLAGLLLESCANRQRALFFLYKHGLKLIEFLVAADGGRSERATETTLPTYLFCSVKENRKPLTDEATRRGGECLRETWP